MAIRYDIGKISKGPSSLVDFLWKIDDFFALSQTVNYTACSPEFHFADAKWRLSILPNGTDETEGWTEIWINKCDSRGPNLRVLWNIGIKCQDGTPYKSHSGEQNLEGNFARCGEIMLLRYSELMEKKEVIAPRGVLTVFCELRLNEEFTVDSSCQTKSTKSADKLVDDLNALLLSGDGSDVSINVNNTSFRVHKAILGSRSRVFAAMFEHPMKEKGAGEVNIVDCDQNVFWEFLRYVYTGKVQEITSEIACKLYDVAEKYEMFELKLECAECMKMTLTVNSFCDVFSVAKRHNEAELLELANNFFSRNRSRIVKTDRWESFTEDNPKLSIELLINAGEKYEDKRLNERV